MNGVISDFLISSSGSKGDSDVICRLPLINLFTFLLIAHGNTAIWYTKGQFHQHFMCSFYTCRSQKRQTILLTWLSFFAHSWSARVKAACRTGGGNIRPAGHIWPAKALFLCLKQYIWPKFGPRDTNKSPMCPADENSCPPLL